VNDVFDWSRSAIRYILEYLKVWTRLKAGVRKLAFDDHLRALEGVQMPRVDWPV
jgi:hypothetical protein